MKNSRYSVLKYSFIVLKHVRKKKKSNYFACFVLTTLTSVSTSTECSEDDLVTTEDTFFSDTGDGQCYSFLSSCFSSLFLFDGLSCLVSSNGSLNNLSIKAILSSFYYFLKLIGNRTLNVVFLSHLSAVIKGSKNFIVQSPLSSFLAPAVSGAQNSGF